MKRFKLFVNEEFCKGCRICVYFCPRDSIRLSDDFNSKGVNVPIPSNMEKCTGCRICEFYCPDFAIAIVEDEGAPAGPETMEKRSLFEGGITSGQES